MANTFERAMELKDKGYSEKEIANELGISVSDLRFTIRSEKAAKRAQKIISDNWPANVSKEERDNAIPLDETPSVIPLYNGVVLESIGSYDQETEAVQILNFWLDIVTVDNKYYKFLMSDSFADQLQAAIDHYRSGSQKTQAM